VIIIGVIIATVSRVEVMAVAGVVAAAGAVYAFRRDPKRV